MNLHDAVFNRKSIRTFVKEDLNKDDISIIKNVLTVHQNIRGPFDHSFEFTFNLNDSQDPNGKKIGTYGILKNVPAYIGGISQNNLESIVDFGYVFELIVLSLTTHDFGTCWLGGTFKRKSYRKQLEQNEIIPAISPVGRKSTSRSIVDKIIRNSAQSDNRLPFNQLFTDINLNPIDHKLGRKLIECLSMVRRAPSASNKQPWRVVVDDANNYVHFYIARTQNYARMLKYDIQALDVGIALAHFEVGLNYYGVNYTREKLEGNPMFEGLDYIISIKQSK